METTLKSKPHVSFEFEVEKIVGVSSDGRYQVQWAPAWVSKFHLVGCEHLIQEFLWQQQAEIENEGDVEGQMNELREENDCKKVDESGKREGNDQNFLQSLTTGVNIKEESADVGLNTYTATQLSSVSKSPASSSTSFSNVNTTSTNGFGEYRYQSQSYEFDAKDVSTNMFVQDPNVPQYSYSEEPNSTLVVQTDNGWAHKCSVCQITFSSANTLNQHIISHSSERKSVSFVTCDYCDYVCKKKSLMNLHMRTHTGERCYSCDKCGKSFKQKGALNIHQRIHDGIRPYTCQVCGKSFSDKSNHNKHIKRCSSTIGLTMFTENDFSEPHVA